MRNAERRVVARYNAAINISLCSFAAQFLLHQGSESTQSLSTIKMLGSSVAIADGREQQNLSERQDFGLFSSCFFWA